MTNKSDTSICPLCEKINQCNVESIHGCWCMNVKVPTELLAKVPEHLKNVSCVCNECISEYHQQDAVNHEARIIKG